MAQRLPARAQFAVSNATAVNNTSTAGAIISGSGGNERFDPQRTYVEQLGPASHQRRVALQHRTTNSKAVVAIR